ncbi:MAG: hypothetical protein ACK55I_00100, partial [bacterium]
MTEVGEVRYFASIQTCRDRRESIGSRYGWPDRGNVFIFLSELKEEIGGMMYRCREVLGVIKHLA